MSDPIPEEQRAKRPVISAGRSVARATGAVAVATALSRVLGMVRDMLVASYFGAGLASDAFFAAFKVPNLLRRLVAEGSLTGAFVPIFTEELAASPERARRAIASATSFTLGISLSLSLLGLMYAEPITVALAPGFGAGTEKALLSASLLRIMFPYTALVAVLALCAAALNCLGRFALPALWPVFLNLGIIAAIVIVAPFVAHPVYVLAWSVLFGGVVSLIPLALMLRRLGYPLALRSPWRDPVVAQLFRLMLPSLLSGSLYQLMVFLNTLLASLLVEGSVTWLYYADRLFQFPLGIFSVAVGTAILPTLARLSASGEHDTLSRQVSQAISWITVITIPASIGLALLAQPIIALVYERGAFVAADTAQTAHALVGFSIGLWSVSVQSILVRAFLAKKRVAISSSVTALSMVVNILAAFVFMGPPVITADPSQITAACIRLSSVLSVMQLGASGLALSGSLGSLTALVLLAALLPWIDIHLDITPLRRCFIRTLLACGPMVAALLILREWQMSAVATVAIGVPGGAALYLATARLVGLREFSEVWNGVRTRLKRGTES